MADYQRSDFSYHQVIPLLQNLFIQSLSSRFQGITHASVHAHDRLECIFGG